MRLIRIADKKVITEDLKVCEGFLDRMLGLLRPGNPRSLHLKTRFGIHTFFLREKIDVLVLDQDFRVVFIRQDLLPNRLFFWNPKYFNVLELPKDMIAKFRIKPSQKLKID